MTQVENSTSRPPPISQTVGSLFARSGPRTRGPSPASLAKAARTLGPAARDMGPAHTIVTVLYDYGDRYLSKLFNPAFLREKDLPVPKWLE